MSTSGCGPGNPRAEEVIERLGQGGATMGFDQFAAFVPAPRTTERVETNHEGTGMVRDLVGPNQLQHGIVRLQSDQPAGRGNAIVERGGALLHPGDQIFGRLADL